MSRNTSQPFVGTDYPARILELLQSNEQPLAAERTELSELLAQRMEECVELESRISDLRRELEASERRLEQKRREISDYKRILSPVRYVPSDILCHLFLYLQDPTEPNDIFPTSLDSTDGPWVLSRVCKRWKDLTLSYPRLWSAIALNGDDLKMDEGRLRRPVKVMMLAVQLHRSASHSLTVSINTFDEIPANHPLLQMLLPSASRWEFLDVFAPSQSLHHLSPMYSDLPVLKTLSVSSKTRLTHFPASFIFEIAPAPRLHTLDGPIDIISACKIPFAQIQIYTDDGTFAYPVAYLSALRAMSDLKKASFSISTSSASTDEFIDNSILEHTTLVLLQVQGKNWESMDSKFSPLLKRLKLPALQSLHLLGLGHDDVDPLLSFFQRSACCETLRTITLKSLSLDDEDCLRILEALPRLKYLHLRCPLVYTPNFLNRLIATNNIVPTLHNLYFDEGSPYGSEELARLKAARRRLKISLW